MTLLKAAALALLLVAAPAHASNDHRATQVKEILGEPAEVLRNKTCGQDVGEPWPCHIYTWTHKENRFLLIVVFSAETGLMRGALVMSLNEDGSPREAQDVMADFHSWLHAKLAKKGQVDL